jgi:hypothetical protein
MLHSRVHVPFRAVFTRPLPVLSFTNAQTTPYHANERLPRRFLAAPGLPTPLTEEPEFPRTQLRRVPRRPEGLEEECDI